MGGAYRDPHWTMESSANGVRGNLRRVGDQASSTAAPVRCLYISFDARPLRCYNRLIVLICPSRRDYCYRL